MNEWKLISFVQNTKFHMICQKDDKVKVVVYMIL